MKLLAICGSPRKGNSFRALTTIRDAFPLIDFEILQLNDMDFSLCNGCYACVLKGESRCPIKDDKELILQKISEADGLILASPVYSHMVSALMKNFFDRFGYLAHRPQFFDKYAMSMVTCSGYGAESALEYMDKMLGIFGFNLAPPLELQIHPGKVKESTLALNREKSIMAVETLTEKIKTGKRDKPSIGLMVPFMIFKYVSKLDKDLMPADYNYYKDKGDYFYDAKIPFYKKFIAKRVSDKIINDFD
jgi:multimeric flavodoxin WrbA